MDTRQLKDRVKALIEEDCRRKIRSVDSLPDDLLKMLYSAMQKLSAEDNVSLFSDIPSQERPSKLSPAELTREYVDSLDDKSQFSIHSIYSYIHTKHPDFTPKRSAISVAISRLVESEKIKRVGYGTYVKSK